MATVPQHLIDEAAKRGIVPGAVVRSPSSKAVFTVPNSGQWWMSDDDMLSGPCDNGNRHLFESEDGWATVLSPAPVEEEGLKDGDACETTPKMREAILELATVLGVSIWPEIHAYHPPKYALYWNDRAQYIGVRYPDVYGTNVITPEAFMTKMRITAAKPKPIKIGEHTVDFMASGDIKVGCTRVDFATLEAIYNKAKATRP